MLRCVPLRCSYGGALAAYGQASVTIDNCTLEGNFASWGGEKELTLCLKLACRQSELLTSAGQAGTEPRLDFGWCWCTYKVAPGACLPLRAYGAGRPVTTSLISSHRLTD